MALAVSLSGCALLEEGRGEGHGYLEGQRLVLEEEERGLSDDEREKIILELTETVSRALFVSEGVVLNEKQRGEIREYIKKELVRVIEESGIDYQGFVGANEAVRQGLELIESGTESLSAFRDVYFELILGLGNEKSGALIYRTALIWLDYQVERSRERYETYGYEWYLADSEDFSRLAREMRDGIDEKELSEALGVLFFSSAIMGGTLVRDGEEIGFEADGRELEVLLRKQREMLNEHTLDGEDWQTVGEVFFKAFFENSDVDEGSDELLKAELIALRDCPTYSRKIAGLVPYFVELYISMTEAADADELEGILAGGDGAKKTVALLALESREELFALLEAIESTELSSDGELKAIDAAGYADEFEEYSSKRKDISSEEFYDILTLYSKGSADEVSLRCAIEDLSFRQAPYITFVFFSETEK